MKCDTDLVIDVTVFQPLRVNAVPIAHLELMGSNLNISIGK